MAEHCHVRPRAQQLEAIFEDDAHAATERRLDEWTRRPLLHKLKDGMAFLLNEQL